MFSNSISQCHLWLRSVQKNHHSCMFAAPRRRPSMFNLWLPLPLDSSKSSITPTNCLRKCPNQISNFAKQVFNAMQKLFVFSAPHRMPPLITSLRHSCLPANCLRKSHNGVSMRWNQYSTCHVLIGEHNQLP